MTGAAERALRGAKWTLDERRYIIARFDSAAVAATAASIAGQERPFYALIVDKDEVTLIAAGDTFEIIRRQLGGLATSEAMYRLITLEVVFALDVIGIIAHISPALAEAGIPILTLSSFSRDHFLVPEDRADEAMRVLRALSAI